MTMTEASQNGAIPWIVKKYIVLYDTIPHLYIPQINLKIGFMSFWMAFFFSVRCLVVPTFVSSGWPEGNISTLDAAASFVGGYFHGPQVVLLSFLLITTQKPYNPSDVSKDHPKWWKDATDATLQLCTAYMVYDFFFLVWTRCVPGQGIILDSDAILYMAHHFMTAFYMTTSRIYGAGQSSALTCVFLGEFTNTLFNTCFIYDMASRVGLVFSPFYAQFITPVELTNAVLYLLFRVVLSPVILSYVSYTLLTNKAVWAHLPFLLRLIWIFMMAAVIYGSVNQNVVCYHIIKGRMGYNSVDQEL